MPTNLSRPQQRGLVLVSAVIVGALLCSHWLENRKKESDLSAGAFRGGKLIIELAGAVQRPGLYTYERAPTVERVLQDGGGPAGEVKIPASRTGEALSVDTRLTVSVGAQGGLSIEKGPLSVRAQWILGRPISLNQATAEELDRVPGIGPGLARRIVERRETVGPFNELEELQQVQGVGEKTLEKLRPYLTVP